MIVEGKGYWFRAPVKRHTMQSEFNIDEMTDLAPPSSTPTLVSR